jgi:hypothetical protein
MGTQIVVDLAARRPELSTLVLIGPVVNPAERRVTVAARRFLQAAWHEPGRVKVLALRAYLVCGVHWFSQVLPKMMTYPIEQQLPKVRAHTLVIRGEHDAVAPSGWVEQIGRLLPSSRLWEMPGAAHSVMHAHAEEVARLCVEHAEQPPRPGEGDELRHYADAGDGSERHEFDFTLHDAAAAAAATVREGVAIARGDDAAVGRAKSDHAEAMLAAHERAERRRDDDGDDGDRDSGDPVDDHEEAGAGDDRDAHRSARDDRTAAS